MNKIHRISSTFKTINGLNKYIDLSPPSIIEKDGFYPGLDNQDTPLKIFQPKRQNGSILILYPGASIKGESHPKMITLAWSLAINGIKVFIPRIPSLINLELSKDAEDTNNEQKKLFFFNKLQELMPGIGFNKKP